MFRKRTPREWAVVDLRRQRIKYNKSRKKLIEKRNNLKELDNAEEGNENTGKA